jgi:hypothetical protein
MGINEYPVERETGIKRHIVTTTDMLWEKKGPRNHSGAWRGAGSSALSGLSRWCGSTNESNQINQNN